MRVLIVHAHHEPKSFCSALFRQAVHALSEAGHEVVISDLYPERFDPISDRRNFSSVFDAGYLKQQSEEKHASEVDGFAPELEIEIKKLESCDLLIFTFPLWWFSMPAILKGWVDRAFPMGRVYDDRAIPAVVVRAPGVPQAGDGGLRGLVSTVQRKVALVTESGYEARVGQV